jgi:hypothetical protein
VKFFTIPYSSSRAAGFLFSILLTSSRQLAGVASKVLEEVCIDDLPIMGGCDALLNSVELVFVQYYDPRAS